MKLRALLGFSLTTLAIVLLSFITDDDLLKNIVQKLEKYRLSYPQEKVHLHLDKPYYAIGDNIWFKAYVVNAEENQLSNLSKVLYVDLINESDSIKQSLRLPLTAGMAWGDFQLADTLREGNYRIRAYTTWMRNFGESYFFDKTITVGNSVSNNYIGNISYQFSKTGNSEKVVADISYTDLDGNPVINKEVDYDVQLDFRNIFKGKATTDEKGNIRVSFTNNQPFILKSGRINTHIKVSENQTINKIFPVKATSNEVAVRFFPEGGELISGIRSRVGFKAVGANGLGVNVKGVIIDQNNTEVADITAEHAGMGSFMLSPVEGNVYKARIRFADGSEKTYNLPAAIKAGYGLSVNPLNKDDLVVRVFISPSLVGSGPITLVAHTNGIINYTAKNNSNGSVFTASIPKKRFPTGILHLTLFSPQSKPVAERLVFINHNDQLNIDLNTARNVYKPREKVKVVLHIKDSLPVKEAALSVSVTDEGKVSFNDVNEVTILSNLLLTSDIRGYVEQPNYYFTSTDENVVRQLDNLLLTQGWRRFVWRNLLADAFPVVSFKPETETIGISGRVLSSSNGKPVAGGKVTLFSSSGDVFLMDTLTDDGGRFNFDRLYFSDSTKFVIQARNAKDRKNVEIILDIMPPQLVTKNKNAADIEINVNKSMMTYLQNSRKQFDELRKFNMSKSIMLSEVKIVEKKQKVTNSSNLNGAGNADAILTADDLNYCNNLAQCLSGRVAGLIIQGGTPYLMRNMPIPMQLIIDGLPVEGGYLSAIYPQDVETIEVLKSVGYTAMYGIRGGGGVMIITTKRGRANHSYRSYTPGILSYSPKGFHQVREFYAPNYDDPEIDPEKPDLRTTVYWNPHIITDKDGKAYFEFFNADGTGNYKIVAEGINADGRIGRAVYRYKVN